MTLTVSGNHRETLSVSSITAPRTPLLLGFPWLRLHNPPLDWTEGDPAIPLQQVSCVHHLPLLVPLTSSAFKLLKGPTIFTTVDL